MEIDGRVGEGSSDGIRAGTREARDAINAVGRVPTQTFRLTCEVVIEGGGDVKAQITYDINQKLRGTTWERLGDKCFRECEKIVNEHFIPTTDEREKDVA